MEAVLRSEAPGREAAPVDEAELVRRAARGEPGAFGPLYRLHLDAVYGYLRFRVRDEALAEDLTQDVFLSALRSIGRLRDPERFGPWLIRIAHNRVVSHWRRRGARPEAPAALDGSDGLDQSPALHEDPIAPAELRLEARGLLSAAAGLTELQQEVLALRFVAGLSVAETAGLMGRSRGAVKNLQHHALKGLRRRLDAAEEAARQARAGESARS